MLKTCIWECVFDRTRELYIRREASVGGSFTRRQTGDVWQSVISYDEDVWNVVQTRCGPIGLDGTFILYYYFITRKDIVDGYHQLVKR